MTIVNRLHIAVTNRLAELRQAGDRGDSPVPTAVIIAGLVVAATAVTGLVLSRANLWMDSIATP
ncbi:hypothetical protein O7606_17860 [Micromonospora sp. WMMD882]|uniref:hypothetical protein n=1 Tax=Micromonospora sp. WMMD882 TaxID=3015151 RepID=UPI00248C618B|nr:hypothetical protein [Micromonospora sp. WMMD882]WBB78103.1 hypothetical protein O7606_17860 [Micromonospora sp. WMMD882]